jgi:maltose/maltodextrin transport system substrate-binding protein
MKFLSHTLSAALLATAIIPSSAIAAHGFKDTLLYRLFTTDAGQHPYIQDIFHQQFVLRNKANFRLKRCLTNISADVPESADITLYVNYDRGYTAMQKLGNCYTQKTGISIAVEHALPGDDMAGIYSDRAASGDAPDLILWAHDRIGQWVEDGYISPISPRRRMFNSVPLTTWEGGKYKGEYYGFPIAIESSALIYNKALTNQPPTSFEEISALDLGAVKAIEWDYKNTYFTWGLLAADGGYPFLQTADGWNASDIGVNNAGAVTGLSAVKNLVETGALDPAANYDSMNEGFLNGSVAMIINGPWSWPTYEAAGIDIGIAPLPTVAGQNGKPFSGIMMYLVSSQSPFQSEAQSFVQNYLLTEEGVALIEEDYPLGGVLNISYVLSDDNNPRILDTLQVAVSGQQMPNIAEMSNFWNPMAKAIEQAISGELTVREALDQAAVEMQ